MVEDQGDEAGLDDRHAGLASFGGHEVGGEVNRRDEDRCEETAHDDPELWCAVDHGGGGFGFGFGFGFGLGLGLELGLGLGLGLGLELGLGLGLELGHLHLACGRPR